MNKKKSQTVQLVYLKECAKIDKYLNFSAVLVTVIMRAPRKISKRWDTRTENLQSPPRQHLLKTTKESAEETCCHLFSRKITYFA